MRKDFHVAATAFVRKSATQENWNDIVFFGLCDCWYYSKAVLRAKWSSHILLWETRSALSAYKSRMTQASISEGKTVNSQVAFYSNNLRCTGHHYQKMLRDGFKRAVNVWMKGGKKN